MVVIGNEILDGRIEDAHFANTRVLLAARNHAMAYALFLPDVPEVIEAHLTWAAARPEPFFCCGGIGSTPDDHTRGCAARVNGVELALHPEGAAILRERFGRELLILGAVDKFALMGDRKRVEDEVMDKVRTLIRQGGYIPTVDHRVPPDVPLENYLYCLELTDQISDEACTEPPP